MSERRWEAATLLFLAIVPTLLFADVLFGTGSFYIRDVATYHYPGKKVLREIVLGGEFPYWTPFIGAGQPLAANPVHQVFYPPTWLILLPDFHKSFQLLALLHVYLATFGMYALLRSMKLGRAASCFGALSFGVGGLVVSMLNLFPLLYSTAWLPVTCLFTRRFLQTRSRRDLAFAALSFAMQLVIGEPVTALQTGVILGSYAIARGMREGGWRIAAKQVGMIGVISIAALLLSSIQTIPAVDHLADSGRGRGIAFDELTQWSAPPFRIVELLFPDILGRWNIGGTPIYAAANLYPGHVQPLFFSVYAGFALALLAIAGAIARIRGTRLFLVLIAFSWLLAAGSHTPLYRFLDAVGLVRFIRFPEKFLTTTVFVTIVFGACALERILGGDLRVRRAALGAAATLALLAFSAAAFAYLPVYESLLRQLYRIDATADVADMVPLSQTKWLIAGLRAVLLLVLLRTVTHGRRAIWLACFGAFLLLDLAPQVPEIAPRYADAYFREPPPILRRFPPDHADFRIFPIVDWVRPSGLGPRSGGISADHDWARRNELVAQMPGMYGLRTAIDVDVDATKLRAERDFVSSVWELSKKPRPADWIDTVAAMSNVWFISSYKKPQEIARDVPVRDRERVKFLEGRHYPRYYFATQLVTIRNRAEFVRALRTQHFPREVAFIHEPAFAPAQGRVVNVREWMNGARIDVEAAGRAFLVVSVTPHKYWRITIDGAEVPAFVTNVGYQGVVVPAGRHTMEMRYRNPLVSVGAAVSAAALLALLLLAFRR
ncbi:MAG TPA: hypothetical protein VF215_00505 [Thermoanaerobaculia bacterium]